MRRPLTALAGQADQSLSGPRTEAGSRLTDRVELGAFLRRRREALTPEEVGLPVAGRRRTPGLRRDEVATLACMSTNYYERLEQARGPQPSVSLLAAIARALRMSTDERDYLYQLAGQAQPAPSHQPRGVDPELVSITESLIPTTIALVMDDLGTVLQQNQLSVAIFDKFAGRRGRADNILWRWFTDLRWRNSLTRKDDQEESSRSYVAELRAAVANHGHDETAVELVRDLRAASTEFTDLWDRHEVSLLRPAPKTLLHPRGELTVKCAVVHGREAGQRLLVFRPLPGTDTEARLDRLNHQYA
jgi:transcriptional regulator with XRE-family HTH domain